MTTVTPQPTSITAQTTANAPAQPRYKLTDADRARKKRIKAAWDAYLGNFPRPLKLPDDGVDDMVLSNRCSPIVNTGGAFLFNLPLGIEISVQDDPSTPDVDESKTPSPAMAQALDDAQDYLDKTWGEEDDRMVLLSKLHTNGAVAGQAFLRLMEPETPQDYPRLIVLDPSIVSIETESDDCDCVCAYIIEYTDQTTGNTYHEEIREDEATETWTIEDWVVSKGGQTFTLIDYQIWPYQWAPIIDCQNLPMPNEHWGLEDLTPDLIQQNKQLNFVQSTIARVLKFYAGPWIYANGMGNTKLDVQPGKVISLPHIDSKLTAVQLTSDLANALQFLANLRADMDEQSAVPAIATGRVSELPRGQISGIALRQLYSSLLAKTKHKRRLYGKLIREVSQRVLEMGGFKELVEIKLLWQDPLPVDVLQEAQAALLKQQLHVSDATLLSELGYDPDEELAKSQAEDATKLSSFGQGLGMPPPANMPMNQPGTPPTVPPEKPMTPE